MDMIKNARIHDKGKTIEIEAINDGQCGTIWIDAKDLIDLANIIKYWD